MDFLTSPSSLALAIFAATGWLFALACFIGFHRPRKSTPARQLNAVSRPANLISIEDLRARHEQIHGHRAA